jgi:hypothetical protein
MNEFLFYEEILSSVYIQYYKITSIYDVDTTFNQKTTLLNNTTFPRYNLTFFDKYHSLFLNNRNLVYLQKDVWSTQDENNERILLFRECRDILIIWISMNFLIIQHF